jgi:two-component system, chemotaxis family, chemotaxis protein CheY
MGLKILIVEDDAVSAELLRDILNMEPGRDIKLAATGWDAWKMLTGFRDGFDVVILDLSLPELDGLELLKRIKASPALKSLPVIVCTGKSDRDTVAQVLALGIRHYIVKPISPGVVSAKLADALATRPATANVTKTPGAV